MDKAPRFDVSRRMAVRYCVRELEDGTRCGHHIIIHRNRCQGLDAWGNPCKCLGYEEPRQQ